MPTTHHTRTATPRAGRALSPALRSAASVCAAFVVLSGCSGDGSPSAAPGSAAPAITAGHPTPYDPPTRFATDARVFLKAPQLRYDQTENLPVTLADTRAYFTDGAQVAAVDLTTGKTLWAARPPTPLADDAPSPEHDTLSPPVPITAGGTPLILAIFEVAAPAQGTTASRRYVELLAANAKTGAVTWTARLPRQQDLYQAHQAWSRLLGADHQTAVVSTGDTLYGIDLQTHQPRWSKNNVKGLLLADQRIVTVEPAEDNTPQQITALNTADGKTAWIGAKGAWNVTARAAGPQQIVITADDYGSGKDMLTVLTATDGKPAPGFTDLNQHPDAVCRYDQRSVTVCSAGRYSPKWAAGYDTATGKKLWSLPDTQAGRIAPVITTVWHGTVYGNVPGGNLITLDARTGADRPNPPAIAPVAVNPYTGLIIKDGGLLGFPATG